MQLLQTVFHPPTSVTLIMNIRDVPVKKKKEFPWIFVLFSFIRLECFFSFLPFFLMLLFLYYSPNRVNSNVIPQLSLAQIRLHFRFDASKSTLVITGESNLAEFSNHLLNRWFLSSQTGIICQDSNDFLLLNWRESNKINHMFTKFLSLRITNFCSYHKYFLF